MDRIEVFKTVKEECDKHAYGCSDCVFQNRHGECVVDYIPCNWDIEEIKKALAEMEKEK